MTQHFLLSAAARTLTLAFVVRMRDADVERVFIRLRWADNDGNAYCPHCGGTTVYMARRPNGSARWRCKACRKDFSITSGTLFASHKMPLRSCLMAIAIFANEVKGKSMLALSRDLGTQYKTAFVLAHKMREAMGSEVGKFEIGGDGKSAEIDGGYFGGYVKPANKRENRRDRRLRENRSGKRKVVVIIRERGGEALPGVFRSEAEALTFIRANVLPKTTLYADEAAAWDDLHARYELHRINHQESYSLGGEKAVHTNSAEAFFSRMRRDEIGHHHHVAGPYLIRFAEEAAWRETYKRVPNGTQVDRIVGLAMHHKPSADFCGYWQRGRGGMNDHAISRLIAKRAELARIVIELEQELDQYRADLVHIDGALRVLRADLDPETIPPRRRHTRTQYFGRNELSRLCRDTLRIADEPITAEEITLRIMTAKGLDARDARLRAAIRVQAGAVLKRFRRQRVAEASGKGIGATWRLAAEL